MEEDEPENEQGGDEVHQYAADDDAEALPHVLGAELPRLRLGGQVGGGLGLVHHARDGAIAAERHPADAPLGVVGVAAPVVLGQGSEFALGHRAIDRTTFLVRLGVAEVVGRLYSRRLHVLGEELDAPTTVYLLGAHQREARVEEHVEFLHAHLKYTREGEVPQLVNHHEKTESHYELNPLHCF